VEQLPVHGGALLGGCGAAPLQARHYNPSIGRFISQDTYAGSAWEPWTQHLYAYVGNNPVNLVDPTGHAAQYVPTNEGGWNGNNWHVIYASGMSADLSNPLINDFQAGLLGRGYTSSVADFWSLYPMCSGPCKADVLVTEWKGLKTGLSDDFADVLSGQISSLHDQGQQVVLVGHSMGGTLMANAALELVARGIKIDSLVLMGGAVRQEVIDSLRQAGVNVHTFANSCDDVPELAADGSWAALPWLGLAGNDADCHQLNGYFSSSHLNSTLDEINKATQE
jgi:RHS repeat-associated protein